MAYESFYGGRQGASFILKKKYASIAEMKAEFQQGGVTLREVNYGEYVMINPGNINDPHNGKIFRRGMDLGNEYGGGIYIGQIQGPEGKIKNLEVGDYNSEASEPQGGHGEYTPAKVAPGKENNGIKYSQVNLLDEHGYIEKYLIGFEFPYFQQEWEIKLIDPYDIPEELIEDVTPLDDEDPQSGHAGQGDRPFYRKYELSVPKGVKGDSVIDAAGVPTQINTGTYLYNEVDEDTHELKTKDTDPITEPIVLEFKDLIDYEETKKYRYIHFTLNDVDKYAYLINTGNEFQHMGFLVNKFDESAQGTSEQLDAGINNYIAEMVITDGSGTGDNYSESDHLLVYYSDENIRQSIPLSKRVKQKNKVDWLDLGYVKGKPGNAPIIGQIYSLDELYNDPEHENPKTPSDIGGSSYYDGQVVSLDTGGVNQEIYAYDRIHTHDWYRLGVYGSGGNGEFKIQATEPDISVDGIQGKTEPITIVG